MSWTQKIILLLTAILTLGTAVMVARSEEGIWSYLWFREHLLRQQKINQKATLRNLRLRRRIIALRYDRRVQEREVRDLLSLTRRGEVLVILTRQRTKGHAPLRYK